MVKRLMNRKGQSILEYLVIATIVVLAVLAIRGTVTEKMNNVMTESTNKVDEAATALQSFKLEKP